MKSVICAGLMASTLVVGGLWAQTGGSGTTTPNTDFFGGLYGKPGDAVRIVTLEANLSTLNQNPPVTGRDASGRAMIEIRFDQATTGGANPSTTKATVSVNITATTTQNEVATAAHIHRGARGMNGPVVIDFNLPAATNTVAGQMATIATTFEVTDSTMLATLNEIVNNPGAFYVNVHTQSNPNGHIRGQLAESSLAATRRLEQRLAAYTEKDLIDIKRLVVRLAQKEGLISSDEANQLLTPLESRPQ
ncbi:MAG: CHRD domain-containing protein [Acidobacteriota bacterium]